MYTRPSVSRSYLDVLPSNPGNDFQFNEAFTHPNFHTAGIVLCYQELRVALLAASCLTRGATTLVTSLLHTSDHTDTTNALRAEYKQLQIGIRKMQYAMAHPKPHAATRDPPNYASSISHLRKRQHHLLTMFNYAR